MANNLTMLDFIEGRIRYEQSGTTLTKSRFKEIRRHGTEEELKTAIEEMILAGGYENLAD